MPTLSAVEFFLRNSPGGSTSSFDTYSLWTKDSEPTVGPMTTIQTLSPQEQRMIALLAEVHEKTVARYARGEPVRPGSRHRIERALQQIKSFRGG